MIYPSDETYNSIARGGELTHGFFEGKIEENFLVGINKDISQEQFDYLYTYLQEKINHIKTQPRLAEETAEL